MNEVAPISERSAQSAAGSDIAQAFDHSTAIVNNIVNQYQAAPPRPVDLAEIARAKALLAELPLDRLPGPDPEGLPPGSVMPWRRNHFFIGREPDLRRLARA